MEIFPVSLKTKIKIHMLGAGQDVGRSCIIVEHSNFPI